MIKIKTTFSFIRCAGRRAMFGEAKYNYAVVSMFSQDVVAVYTSLLERLWYDRYLYILLGWVFQFELN